eukprot:3940876-Rhodomonas_salina.1
MCIRDSLLTSLHPSTLSRHVPYLYLATTLLNFGTVMCGTVLAVLCAVQYRATVWCYAVCGTELGASRDGRGATNCLLCLKEVPPSLPPSLSLSTHPSTHPSLCSFRPVACPSPPARVQGMVTRVHGRQAHTRLGDAFKASQMIHLLQVLSLSPPTLPSYPPILLPSYPPLLPAHPPSLILSHPLSFSRLFLVSSTLLCSSPPLLLASNASIYRGTAAMYRSKAAIYGFSADI